MFKYERLMDICFVCGCLDHHESKCVIAFHMRRLGEAVRRDYGPWLSAEFRGPIPCLSHTNHKGITTNTIDGPAMHSGVCMTGDYKLHEKGKNVISTHEDGYILNPNKDKNHQSIILGVVTEMNNTSAPEKPLLGPSTSSIALTKTCKMVSSLKMVENKCPRG
ncbi:hypothetical protein REPUB_Repub17cG0045100 [Reevesia pubescens]